MRRYLFSEPLRFSESFSKQVVPKNLLESSQSLLKLICVLPYAEDNRASFFWQNKPVCPSSRLNNGCRTILGHDYLCRPARREPGFITMCHESRRLRPYPNDIHLFKESHKSERPPSEPDGISPFTESDKNTESHKSERPPSEPGGIHSSTKSQGAVAAVFWLLSRRIQDPGGSMRAIFPSTIPTAFRLSSQKSQDPGSGPVPSKFRISRLHRSQDPRGGREHHFQPLLPTAPARFHTSDVDLFHRETTPSPRARRASCSVAVSQTRRDLFQQQ